MVTVDVECSLQSVDLVKFQPRIRNWVVPLGTKAIPSPKSFGTRSWGRRGTLPPSEFETGFQPNLRSSGSRESRDGITPAAMADALQACRDGLALGKRTE